MVSTTALPAGTPTNDAERIALERAELLAYLEGRSDPAIPDRLTYAYARGKVRERLAELDADEHHLYGSARKWTGSCLNHGTPVDLDEYGHCQRCLAEQWLRTRIGDRP